MAVTGTKRFFWLLAVLVGLSTALALCLRGDRVTAPGQAPQGSLRIVSLAPSVTEVLFRLGAGEMLVGVTDRCDYPPAARRIRSVGGFGSPNVETLLALAPDLVIATGMERPDAAAALQRAGIEVLWVKTGSFAELFASVRQIGRRIGKADEAERLVKSMQARLDAVVRRWQATPVEKRPRVFVEVWYDPLTTAGAGSFLDEVIAKAGGVNVAGQIDEAYPTVNPEKVVQWNPDVIVLGYMNQQAARAAIGRRIGWDEIRAVREGRIVSDISSDILLRPGPRLVEGVDALNRALYGSDSPAPAGRAGTKPQRFACPGK